jgi:hypothetical protein
MIEVPTMTMQRPQDEFHLNGLKKYLVGVAISLTTTLLIQSASLVWWAGTVETRLQYYDKHLDSLNVRVHDIETTHVVRP